MNELKNKFQNQVITDSDDNFKLKWWSSWPAIIIFISTGILAPIGIYFMIKRIKVDKKAILVPIKLSSIFGWIPVGIAIMGVIVSISQGMRRQDVYAMVFCCIFTIWFVLSARNAKKNIEKFNKYILIIKNRGITSIDSIAAIIPVSYEVCKKDLQKMINKGYLTDCYIDDLAREIILPKYNNNVSNESTVNNIEENVELKVVICKGCGAKNTVVKGSAGECEFCGSPIS